MGLLSEIDWLILLSVGAFLLLGPQSTGVLRKLGRIYARLIHAKDELLGEVSSAAGIPRSAVSGGSLRSAFLGFGATGPTPGSAPSIPMAVASAPGTAIASVAVRLDPVATSCAVGAIGPGSWSWATAPSPVVRPVAREGTG